MTPEAFRDAITTLGLRQTDFAQLLAHLSGATTYVATVNRWACRRPSGRRVPATVIAILALLEILPAAGRRRLFLDAGCKTPPDHPAG